MGREVSSGSTGAMTPSTLQWAGTSPFASLQAGAASVTVLHADSELADAAATALMVAGPQRFAEIAARMGIDSALLIETDTRQHMTPTMQLRLTAGTAANRSQ